MKREIRNPILEARGVVKAFGGLVAVNNVDLAVGKGEIVGLIGPNGSGKSTLVNLFGGELDVTRGELRFGDQMITHLPVFQRARLGLARSFQMLRLFGSLSVEENLLLAHHIRMQSSVWSTFLGRRQAQIEEQKVRERARELLAWFELDKFASRPVVALSIGQQRMVELARGLISDPRLFMLDEPAAGLAPPNVDRLINLIHRMRDELGISILIIEHDMRVIREVCDHVYVLDSGAMIAEGRPAEVSEDAAVIEAYIGSGWKRRARA